MNLILREFNSVYFYTSCPGDGENNFAKTCQLDRFTGSYKCDCMTGFTGDKCEKCTYSYFGNPLRVGGSCQLCNCSGNVNTNERQTCDSETGIALFTLWLK